MSPAPGFAAGHPHNIWEHSRSFIQGEPLVPDLRPWHYVEGLNSCLCRVSCNILSDHDFGYLLEFLLLIW